MTPLATHVIRQRNFYPVYPPPLEAGDGLPAVGMEPSLAHELRLRVVPDVLVMPSQVFPAGVKVLRFGGRMVSVVNPGMGGKGGCVVLTVGEGGTIAAEPVGAGAGKG